jgi:hypothetical protein
MAPYLGEHPDGNLLRALLFGLHAELVPRSLGADLTDSLRRSTSAPHGLKQRQRHDH